MKRKEDTPIRKARRKYEQSNQEQRMQATKQFNTRISTQQYEEISAFLKKHRITKVQLIYEGYRSLVDRYEKKSE